MTFETLLKGRMNAFSLPYEPTPALFSHFTSARRASIRPATARDADFDDKFDADTLFFDAVRAPDSPHIIAIGPPLLNLSDQLENASAFDSKTGLPLRFKIRNLDRQMQIWIEAPAEVAAVELRTALGPVTFEARPNRSDMFSGRRVLLTKSKNNPLPWIKDWIRFNRDVNGADAVLFYDNGSTLYSTAELVRALETVRGMKQVEVVRWPFKFGPQGIGWSKHWDSDFCELGILEHARWRYLHDARSVMNCDIDELTFGRTGVFEATENSLSGIVRCYGRWIVASSRDITAAEEQLGGRRHRHYDMVLRKKAGLSRRFFPVDLNRSNSKWILVPSRCPRWAQWHVHKIKGWPSSLLTRRDISFRHFRHMNTSWKYDREDDFAVEKYSCKRDLELTRAFEKVNWLA